MSIQLTEAEYLILSSLPYSNMFPAENFDSNGYPIEGAKIDLESILSDLKNKALGKDYKNEEFVGDLDNYISAIESLTQKLKSSNFIISKCINHNSASESGFFAVAIEPDPNPDNEVVICCRGSDSLDLEHIYEYFLGGGKNRNDWVDTNIALLANEMNVQQSEMIKFMKGFDKYDGVYLTGHSLGGNLAIYGAIIMNNPDKIKGVYAFDAPGFNTEFINIYQQSIDELNFKIHNFQNEHDLVSSSLVSVGDIQIISSSIDSNHVFTNHNRWAFNVDESGNLVRNSTQEKDVFCSGYNILSKAASKLMNNPNETHDFSENARTEIISVINNVESAEFSSLNDWKNYYNCGWFIKSSAKYSKDQIEEWYETLSQSNNNCKRKIVSLFNTMENIDKNSCEEITSISTNLESIKNSIQNDFICRIKVE